MSVRSARYNLLSLRNPKGLTIIPEERDAWAFLDAAKITSSRQQRAIIELVRGLRHAQLWSKMKAIYPFVGGTATTHKFNLKDPRDVDAAFRLSFSGGWTHASTGALPNGTNAYADTFLRIADNYSTRFMSMSYYARTDSNITYTSNGLMGAFRNPNMFAYLLPGETLLHYNINSSTVATAFSTNEKGHWIGSRENNTSLKVYKNATTHATATGDASTSNLTGFSSKIFVGALSNNSDTLAYAFTDCGCAFATIGDGLTDTDATNLYNIVQRFQTSLGRQV